MKTLKDLPCFGHWTNWLAAGAKGAAEDARRKAEEALAALVAEREAAQQVRRNNRVVSATFHGS